MGGKEYDDWVNDGRPPEWDGITPSEHETLDNEKATHIVVVYDMDGPIDVYGPFTKSKATDWVKRNKKLYNSRGCQLNPLELFVPPEP